MRQWTWSELKEKLQDDLDLQEEQFIDEVELLAYANEAIDDVEAEIHSLYEDYFLTSQSVSTTLGSRTVALPSDIYAWKIRNFMFDSGTLHYEVFPVKSLRKLPGIEPEENYRYIMRNDPAAGMQIRLYPIARETSSTNLTLWYIRNASVLTSDVSTCDIPEFANYVLQHVKVRCYEKEGHPNLPQAMAERDRLKLLMVETLENMKDDENDEIPQDFTHYEEHE